MKVNAMAWNKVTNKLPQLPSVVKYSKETWEWTIGRDFKDRVAESGAALLELAIADIEKDVMPLISAIYFLESAIEMELKAIAENFREENKNREAALSTSLLKNAGLSHVHLLKSKKIGQVVKIRGTVVSIKEMDESSNLGSINLEERMNDSLENLTQTFVGTLMEVEDLALHNGLAAVHFR